MAEHFGLDIGADSIKIVQFRKEKNSYLVTAAGMAKNPLANFNLEDEKNFVALAEAIKKLKQDARVTTNAAVVSLPERSAFSQVIEMPKMSEKELEQAVPWEAENVIPRSLAEVNLDWEVIEEEQTSEGQKIKVLLVAAPSNLIDKYLQLLKLAEVETLSLETESLAAVRALRPVIQTGNAALINMGEKSLDVFLVHLGHLCLSRQLPSAGEALTRTVASTLGLDLTAAEEYKKAYGLSPQLEGKVAAALTPVLSSAVNEIQKTLRFYEETYKESLKLAIIFGGTALLPGITEYLTRVLGLEVQVADPFAVLVGNQPDMQVFKANAPLFTVACGLAMKEV